MSLKDQLQKQIEKSAGSFKSVSGSDSEGLIKAVFIPIKVERDGGELRIYLEVSPEAVENKEMLKATLDELNKSFDLATWKSKNSYQNENGFKRNNWNNNNRNRY